VRDVAFADNGLVQGPAGGVVTVSVTNGDGSTVLTVCSECPVPDPTKRASTGLLAGATGGRRPGGRPGFLGLSFVERERRTI
jgi:hypothetical protein